MIGKLAFLVVALLVASCSFVTIRAPRTTDPPPRDPRAIRCTESALFPGLDALAGAAAVATMGAGIVIEKTSDTGTAENFTRYYALPALALGIIYFYAASFGSGHVERCQELKAAAAAIQAIEPPTEIDMTP